MESLLSFLSFKFDYKSLDPNLPLMRSFHRKCGTLYDGYQFAINKPNGSLAGFRLEGTTIPFMFGYNEYYELNETFHSQFEDLEPRKTVILWCGELYSGVERALSRSGGQGVFRAMPGGVESFLNFFMATHAVANFGPMFSAAFDYFSLFIRGPFLMETDGSNMITRKIYLRREYAFLQSFTTETWLCLLGTLLVMSLLASLVGRKSTTPLPDNQHQTYVLWFNRSVVQEAEQYQFRLRLVTWWTCSLHFFGFILGQGQPQLCHFYRGIVGVWLLFSIIFNGCLSSSLRDLMSKAQVVLTPDEYDDIFHGSAYENHVIVLTNYLPSWQEIHDNYRVELRERQDTGKLFIFDPFKAILDKTRGVVLLMRRLINALLETDRHVLIAFKRIFYVVMWGMTVCRHAVDRMYALLVKDGNSDGDDNVLVEFQGIAPVGDEAIRRAHQRIEDMLREIREHVTISPGRGSMQWYLILLAQCPPQVESYFNGFFDYFRDAGFIQLLDEKADEALQRKFVTSQELAWQDSAAGWEVICMQDLTGPLLAYASLIAFSLIVLLAEVLSVKMGKSKNAIIPIIRVTGETDEETSAGSVPRPRVPVRVHLTPRRSSRFLRPPQV